MADYISGVSAATEISLAPKVGRDFYFTLEMANLALNGIEEDTEDCMDWATFGVGGPA